MAWMTSSSLTTIFCRSRLDTDETREVYKESRWEVECVQCAQIWGKCICNIRVTRDTINDRRARRWRKTIELFDFRPERILHTLLVLPAEKRRNRYRSCVQHQCEPPYTVFMRAVDQVVSRSRPPSINRRPTRTERAFFTAWQLHAHAHMTGRRISLSVTNGCKITTF